MKSLRGALPTESDMSQTGMEIHSLSEREDSLDPQLRGTFHEQLRSAENQLGLIRAEMVNPRPETASGSAELRKSIAQLWSKLSTTLVRAEAYCT